MQILKVKSYFTAQVFIYGAYEIQIWNKNLIVFELRQFCILETITISINFKSNFFKLTLIVFNLETSLFSIVSFGIELISFFSRKGRFIVYVFWPQSRFVSIVLEDGVVFASSGIRKDVKLFKEMFSHLFTQWSCGVVNNLESSPNKNIKTVFWLHSSTSTKY